MCPLLGSRSNRTSNSKHGNCAGAILLMALGSSFWPHVSLAAGKAEISRLAWLEGRWTGTQDGIETEELWTGTQGQAMLGMHKDVKAGLMIQFEFFRIAPTAVDSICYFASPKGAPPTPFCMIECGEKRVVFENRGHDFPQRILYWLDENSHLHARIEGTIGGKDESETWIWTKAVSR